ncbi:MAG: hypothetical protein K2N33_02255, partial [Clostridia bacterium]|nr:hypothetical protein [Clostridia bacterium]
DKLSAEDLFAALKEKKITASGLADDIRFLLNDYFVCSLSPDGERIEVTFLNGQKFEICVKEIN